ncbi:MAG: AAA family ATPase [Pirellulales bacterium]
MNDTAPSEPPADAPGEIVRFLQSPQAHGTPAQPVELIETHISWVFLTDRHAYKLKKPVKFGFLDFSTSEARRRACEDEVRLNERLAPGVYQGVVPVVRRRSGGLALASEGEPTGEDAGKVVDWVVAMQRLDHDQAVDVRIRTGRLTQEQVRQISDRLTDFYRRLPPLELSGEDYRHRIEQHVRDNLEVLSDPDHGLDAASVRRVHQRQLRFVRLGRTVLDERAAAGKILEGHGDLRPEHIFLTPEPVVIDCLEFSLDLRTIDVADELAFLAMECERLGADWVGRQIRTAYEYDCDDASPDELFDFYKSYRACVRAKVNVLRLAQTHDDERQHATTLVNEYLHLADCASERFGHPLVAVVTGLSGTGKSTLAEEIAGAWQAALRQTDQIRKSLFGSGDLSAAPDKGVYHPELRAKVYEQMMHEAEELLREGHWVVLDGTFLTPGALASARQLAGRHGALWLLVRCECPAEIAMQRISQRKAAGGSVSDADIETCRQQHRQADELMRGYATLVVDTTRPLVDQMEKVERYLVE